MVGAAVDVGDGVATGLVSDVDGAATESETSVWAALVPQATAATRPNVAKAINSLLFIAI